MRTKSFFSKIGKTISSTGILERPRTKIQGTWLLFEYFVDKDMQLVHLQADDLKVNRESFQIEFRETNFKQVATIPIDFIQNLTCGKWEINRNFIHLIDEKNFRNSVAFQFAFEKDNLKLLRKNKQGKIEFFGFFKKLPA